MESLTDDSVSVEVLLSRFYGILTETALDLAPPGKRSRKSKPWSAELSSAAKKSKVAHHAWVIEGREFGSDSHTTKKQARSGLRQAQRNLAAQKRSKMMFDTMTADVNDHSLFYRLIRQQRGDVDQVTDELMVRGEGLHGEDVKDGWAEYFSDLATPTNDVSFDYQNKLDVELKTLLLCDINAKSGESLPTFSEDDVRKAVSFLKLGKAADELGLAAEHIRYGENQIIPCLTKLINRITCSGKVPDLFKSGLITPVYKKNKKPRNHPDSYRRITITSIVGKVLERLLLPLIQCKFADTQSALQRGFTTGVSCMSAALMLSETINESKDHKSPVWMAMFDASKAFDVVWQNSLLLKLHKTGISGDLWTMLREWYRGQNSTVKWRGDRSKSFFEQQGVRQGGILSPDLYKIFINPLLVNLEESGVGFHIGSIYVGVPTCADDTTVIASKPVDLQTMINAAEAYANQERYKFNCTKTKVLMKHGNKPVRVALEQETDFVLYGKSLDLVDVQTHLGIDRHAGVSDSAVISDRIQCARRTAYSLMGSGFHGLNGLGAACNSRLWNVYVIPRLLYGLEVLNLTKGDLKILENYQTNVIKQFQHLPTRVSTAATLLLLGQQPVEAALDRRILSLLGNVIRTDSVERDIIERQFAMKPSSSCSWTFTVTKILEKYSLPSLMFLLETRPSKTNWKGMVKRSIFGYWTKKLVRDAKQQTSLKYLNVSSLRLGKQHHVWTSVSAEPRDVTRAAVKVKLLTGTYTLQANKAVFNQYEVDKTCPLCRLAPENRQHFILECSSLREVRAPYLVQLYELLWVLNPWECARISTNIDLCLQFILDCSENSVSVAVGGDIKHIELVESITRRMCYALHSRRAAILSAVT